MSTRTAGIIRLSVVVLFVSAAALAQPADGCPAVDTDGDGLVDAREGCPVADSAELVTPETEPVIQPRRAPAIDWCAVANERQNQRDAEDRARLAATAAKEQPKAEPRLTLDLDTIIGARSEVYWVEGYAQTSGRGTFASSLLKIRYRPAPPFSLGAVVPFVIGSAPSCEPRGAGCEGTVTGNLGNLAVFATWEPRVAPTVRLPVEVLMAFATSFPVEEWGSNSEEVSATRGFEDPEFFVADYNFSHSAVVPKVGLIAEVPFGELSASAKVPIVIGYSEWDRRLEATTALVLTGQAMARLPGFSVGARAIFFVQEPLGDSGEQGQLMLEPRVEVRFAGLELRMGLLFAAAGRYRPDENFAWGVRLGVGYGF